MTEPDTKYPGNSLISGGRLVELVLVALCSASISGGITALVATSVLKEQLQSQQRSIDDMRLEIRELRRDIYRPAWPGDTFMPHAHITDLLADLRASLLDSAQYFQGTESDPDADFRRHIRAAAADLGKRRGMTLLGQVELQPGVNFYPAPADAIYITTPLWGTQTRPVPWADNHPGPLPRARIIRENGSDQLMLTPAPTRQQIEALGESYQFIYAASLWDGSENELPVDDEGRALLLLRAQAEAARELAIQGLTKPIETRTSQAMPRNATPAALYQALMDEFNQRAGQG